MSQNFLYLSRSDVQQIDLPMRQIIDAVEQGLRLQGEGAVEMPPKPGIHPRPDAFIHAMPAYIRATESSPEAAGMKWVSGYPQNQGKSLPYINGLLILNDPETGLARAVMDCAWITAMRTGAASAVAAKHLARGDSSSVGILGCGVQGKTNLLALAEVFALKTVRVYDTVAARAESYAREMAASVHADIQPVAAPRQAVADMDVVVTAGPILHKPHETIQPGWLAEGVFACPVDFDSYWSRQALGQFSLLCCDHIDQYRYYEDIGYFQNMPPMHADLGQILTKRKPGRHDHGQRIMCINLGLALEDIAVAALIYERARQTNIGTRLPL